MKQNQAISRILVVAAIVAILIALAIGVTIESGTMTHSGQSTSKSSQTTISSQPFNSTRFLSLSYLEYMLGYPSDASPVGIAAYGIFNYSGSLRSYSINSSEVVGEANISAIATQTNWDNAIYPSYSSLACMQCASLQMNVNVVVETPFGNQIFWGQNVVPFSNTTSQRTLGHFGLIFNMTTSRANIGQNWYGNGSPGQLNGKTVYGFGSLRGSTTNYSLPLHVRLAISVEVYDGGIEIKMSNSPFGYGTFADNNNTFGIVSIPIKNVTSASIVVMPSLYPWQSNMGLYQSYDSDLVWAAYCCGQTTNFVEMNSSLSLQYLNSKNQLESYPSFYTFGYTGESATNLRVIPSLDGELVAIGQNNNSLLDN